MISDNIAAYTTQDRHIINTPQSKYGTISIDWTEQKVTLKLETPTEIAVSTVIPF